MSKVHDLKTWPEYYAKVVSREKTFELRYNDRDYRVNDILHLIEFDPCKGCMGKGRIARFGLIAPPLYVVEHGEKCLDCNGSSGQYTGLRACFLVTYVLSKHEALREGYVILGLRSTGWTPHATQA